MIQQRARLGWFLVLDAAVAISAAAEEPADRSWPCGRLDGEPVTRGLRPGETHRYDLEVGPDALVAVRFASARAGLVVRVVGTTGAVGGELLVGPGVERPIVLLDRRPGSYRVFVERQPDGGAGGEAPYTARVLERRRARQEDYLAAWVRLAKRAEARRAASSARSATLAAAADLREAVRLLEKARNDFQLAHALAALGTTLSDLGDGRGAVQTLERAAESAFRAGDPELEAYSLIYLGTVLVPALAGAGLGGRPDIPKLLGVIVKSILRITPAESLGVDTVAALSHAIELGKRLRRPDIEAAARVVLAAAHFLAGKRQAALEEAHAARKLWPEANVAERTQTLQLLGVIYLTLGDRVRSVYYSAQGFVAANGDPPPGGSAHDPTTPFALYTIGLSQLAQPDPEAIRAGLASLQAAREAWMLHGDLEWQARALSAEAIGLRGTGRPAAALDAARTSAEIFAAQHNPLESALARLVAGELLADLGRMAESIAELEATLAGFERIGLASGAAQAHAGLARGLRRLGDSKQARVHADAALRSFERERSAVESRLFRLTYGAKVHDFYELAVDLAMELGDAAGGLRASELGRARSLLDSLADGEGPVGAPSTDEVRRLQRLLDLKERERLRFLRDARTVERSREIEHEADEIAEQLDRLSRPPGGPVPDSADFDLARLQGLLDGEDLLVELALGDARGHGWAVTRTRLVSFTLPPRAELATLAEQVHGELSGRLLPGEGRPGAARELAQRVLGPIAAQLGARRIFVAADGPLERIPFAALPSPLAESTLLGDGRSVVSIPSAAAFAVAREHERPRPSRRQLLLVGEPAYAPPGGGRERAILPPVRGAAPLARGVASLLPAEGLQVLLGAAATREAVLGPEARGYEIVHFAAHGHIEPFQPESSALVLALFDRDGKEIDGYLRRRDILAIQCDADLVVLAGCETAAGLELPGEGVLGLANAFLHAGARSVLASLWRVDDEATALLMLRFYAGRLARRLAPAAAFSEAQSWLRALTCRERQELRVELGLPSDGAAVDASPEATPYAHPYFWAGFVFVGDPGSGKRL